MPTVPETTTLTRPTASETRPPKMSRLSSSRPNWSVPMMWGIDPPSSGIVIGGLLRMNRLWSFGSKGATQRREDRGDGQQHEEDAGHDRELVLEQRAAIDPQAARGRREDRFVSPRQCRRRGLDRLAHAAHP